MVGVADLSWADYKQVENTDGDRAYEALLLAISILLVLLMIGTSVVFMNSPPLTFDTTPQPASQCCVRTYQVYRIRLVRTVHTGHALSMFSAGV